MIVLTPVGRTERLPPCIRSVPGSSCRTGTWLLSRRGPRDSPRGVPLGRPRRPVAPCNPASQPSRYSTGAGPL